MPRAVKEIEHDLGQLEKYENDPKGSTRARKVAESRLNKEMLASMQAQNSERQEAEENIERATAELRGLYQHALLQCDEFVRAVEALVYARATNYTLYAREARRLGIAFEPVEKFKIRAIGAGKEHDLLPRLRAAVGSDW